MTVFIAVHVGAGHLSRSKESRYRFACSRACEEAMMHLKQGESAMEAVAKAITILEDDPVTNAGYGSNLTINCTVECDASMMDGRNGNFGAVGAVSGRIPPMLLAGSGAKAWAEGQNLQIVDDGSLLTEEALATYGKHMQLLHSEVDDTVGAIAIDVQGNVAAGVSSGGISLKFPGRVGEAAMYGCGCWAQNGTEDQPAIACSTSGTGEQIMRTRITTRCAEQLVQSDDIPSTIYRVLHEDFLESPYLQMYNDKSVGMITLRAVKSADGSKQHVEFCYAHVTESMGIGSMSGTSKKPKTFVSRKTAREAMKSSDIVPDDYLKGLKARVENVTKSSVSKQLRAFVYEALQLHMDR